MLKAQAIPLTISLILFFIPFFWFSDRSYDLGGDDTRLYYAYPDEWSVNRTPYSWTTTDGLSNYYPFLHAHWSLNELLVFLHSLLPSLHLQAFVYGILLSTAFISTYALILLFLKMSENNTKKWQIQIIGLLGGLLYVLSPLGHYWWRNPLSDIFGFALFPLLIFIFFKSVETRKWVYLVLGALASLFYSPVFNQFPYYIPYIIGMLIIAVLLVILVPEYRKTIPLYGLIYIGILFLVQSFWIVPLTASFIVGDNSLASSVSSSTTVNISAQWKNLNIVDTLMGLGSRKFREVLGLSYMGQKHIWFSFLVPIVTFIPLLFFRKFASKKEKTVFALYISFVIASLILAYFYTVGVTSFGPPVFKGIIRLVPLFGMFKNFFSKFPAPYMYFYSICFAIGLFTIYKFVKNVRIYQVLFVLVGFSILLHGLPFIRADFMRVSMVKNDTTLTRVAFPESYEKTAQCIAQEPRARVLSLPLAMGSYSLVKSDTDNNFYVGSSPIVVFTHHDELNGMPVFRYIDLNLYDITAKAFVEQDFDSIQNALNFYGVRYVLVNENVDQFATDRFKSFYVWGYPKVGTKTYIDTFINKLNLEEVCRFQGHVMYKMPTGDVVPMVYIPKSIVPQNDQTIVSLFGQRVNPTTAFVETSINTDLNTEEYTTNAQIQILSSERGGYEAHVTDVVGDTLVVLSEQYHSGWKATITLSNGRQYELPEHQHIKANIIMNGWLIPKSVLEGNDEFRITLQFVHQKYLSLGKTISMISALIMIVIVLYYCILKMYERRR